MGNYIFFTAIGKHHVDLFLVIVSALCIRSMHGVMARALCEHHQHHPISLVILCWTKVQPRYGTGNSIIDAFDVYNFEAILLK
jgi:hypothetical protein